MVRRGQTSPDGLGVRNKGKPADTLEDDRLLVRATLREVMSSDAPAAAKAQAARTLAELTGLLGRHQDKPDSQDSRALSALSQDELRAELRRLKGLGP